MFYSLLFLVFFRILGCDQINQARNDFYTINSEDSINNFLNKYSENDCGAIPAYRAAVYMRQAQFTSMPNKKISFFKKGKSQLESFIASHPNDIEGRFNRYLVQKQLPKILNYYQNTSEDYNFIQKNIGASSIDDSYKKKILKTINDLK